MLDRNQKLMDPTWKWPLYDVYRRKVRRMTVATQLREPNFLDKCYKVWWYCWDNEIKSLWGIRRV